jgi:hypothetical protein
MHVEHLKRWTANGPTAFDSNRNYAGPDLSAFYVAPVGTNRDADTLTRSNWAVVSADILASATNEETAIHRFGHWACGWYELLLIHADDEAALRCAEEWACTLADYPVASDDHFSELEYTEASDYWSQMSVADRLAALERSGARGVSMFAARRDDLPSDDCGALQQYLNG